MRPITTLTMCAYLSVAIAAAPAAAASPAFIKLGGVDGESTKAGDKHKNEIEILSWSWGETHRADALTDGLLIVRNSEPGAAKVSKVEGIAIKQTVGRNSGAAAAGGPRVAAGDVNADGADAKFGAVSGMHRNNGVAGPAPAEKRQHGWVTVSKPLDRGAVRIKVKFPWVGCAIGTRYPALTLGGGTEQYELTDAVISDCAGDSVSFNYAKVKVRGWNPETK